MFEMLKENTINSALFLNLPDKKQWGYIVGAMKPGAHLLLLSSVKEHHVGTIAAEDAGLEIRDTLAYVFADSENDVGMMLVTVARKPLDGTVAENTLRYGTGGINVDKCRIGLQPEEDVEKLNKRSGGTRGFGSASVYGEGTTGPGTDLSKGRWPANLILQDCPAVRAMFPNSESNKGKPRVGLVGNSIRLNNSKHAQVNCEYSDSGSAARFFHSAPTLNTLINYLLKLVTPPGGTVLTSPNFPITTDEFHLIEDYGKTKGIIVSS